jgi:asparagine N-glycosylation enzyme membrane subunit Stt3
VTRVNDAEPARLPQPGPPPPPLVVAAGLVGVEGLVMLGYGVLEAADIHASRAAMGASTALLFLALGVGLCWFGWVVVRGGAWARSPIVVAQVIFLGLAWSFRGGSTTWVAVVMAVVALVVLAGVLHPASIAALGDRTPAAPGDGQGGPG